MADLRKGKIVFIDDQAGTIVHFMDHLRDEGYTNVLHLASLRTLNEVLAVDADVVILDIAGVATNLDAKDEGVSVLRHLKQFTPWTRIVVLSGSTFDVARVPSLALADQLRTKGSLSLAEFVSLVHSELEKALSPEWRNPRIFREILRRLDELPLGAFRRWRIRRSLARALEQEGDKDYDWSNATNKTRELLSTVADVAGLLALLV